MADAAGRDLGKWFIAVLVVGVGVSQIHVLRQNRELRKRVNAASSISARVDSLRSKTDRTLLEASMTGRCRPFFDSASAAKPRPVDVSIYFSIDHDCLSCVIDVVGQWNGVLRSSAAESVKVKAYTNIDGTGAQRVIDRDLKPAFPVEHVEGIEAKLAMAGINSTPVVFVSEPATGRILMTYAPKPGEKSDRSLAERVVAMMTPCS